MSDEKPQEIMAYIAQCRKCGGFVMACVDLPAHRNRNAEEIASCVKEGYEINRVTCEEVRTAKWCDCKKEFNS